MSYLVSINCLISSAMVVTISFIIGSSGTATVEPVWNVKQYFEQKLKMKPTQLSSLESNASEELMTPVQFHTKLYLGIFHAKYGIRDQSMAHCKTKDDCDAGIRMICRDNRCACRIGELFFEWPKFGCFVKAQMFEKCEVSGQCMTMNPNTYCNPENGRCTCSPNYFFNGHECSLRYDNNGNLKAQEVYKAAVVAAACFIVAVVGIFVACIVRRSFCRREQQLQQSESNRNSDVFSISDEIAALRAVDKPPSYEEVLQIERTFYGIPPPEYSGPRNEISPVLPLSTEISVPPDTALTYNPPNNPSYNPPCQSVTVASSSGCSSLNDDLKESTSTIPNLSESSSDNSHLQTINVSDFITAAEVLPVPSPLENSILNSPPLLPVTPSHSAHTNNHSSTPPPRPHQNHLKCEQGSSSLPNSPFLSHNSSKANSAFVDLHTSSRKKLLKQDSSTSQPEMPHWSQDSFVSYSETSSNSSIPQEIGTSNNASEFDHSVTVIAYDNLGFESDLYL